MIQRIQSIFLLLAALAFAGLFKLPFASTSESTSPIFEDMLYNIADNTILLILTILGIVIAIVNIFMFRNRALQLRLGYILIIIAIFLPVVAMWIFFTLSNKLTVTANVTDGLGIYLPLVSLVTAILANRYINKDHKTVKSMDRLR